MIGASGAISAVMGTYALLYSQQQVKAIGPLSAHPVRILWLAAAWMAIQFLIGIVRLGGIGRIAIGAPVGGSVAGPLLNRPFVLLRFEVGRQSVRVIVWHPVWVSVDAGFLKQNTTDMYR